MELEYFVHRLESHGDEQLPIFKATVLVMPLAARRDPKAGEMLALTFTLPPTKTSHETAGFGSAAQAAVALAQALLPADTAAVHLQAMLQAEQTRLDAEQGRPLPGA